MVGAHPCTFPGWGPRVLCRAGTTLPRGALGRGAGHGVPSSCRLRPHARELGPQASHGHSLPTPRGERRPYQDHVAGGDVHVGLHWLLRPGRGAAPRGGAGHRPVTELRGHAADAGRVRGLRALGRARGHALPAQLLQDSGRRSEPPYLRPQGQGRRDPPVTTHRCTHATQRHTQVHTQ